MMILSHEAVFTVDGVRCAVVTTRPEALMPAVPVVEEAVSAAEVRVAYWQRMGIASLAKARLAERIVARLRALLPGGFMVRSGDELATAGERPDGGWQLLPAAA